MSDDKKIGAKRALELIKGENPAPQADTPVGQEMLGALTDEDKAWAVEYQNLIQDLAMRLGKSVMGPVATFEQGSQLLDQYTLEVGEHIVEKFRGDIGLADMVAFLGGIVGYQIGVSRSKGYDIPPDMADEAGRVFAIAVKLISIQMAHALEGTDGSPKLWTPPGAG